MRFWGGMVIKNLNFLIINLISFFVLYVEYIIFINFCVLMIMLIKCFMLEIKGFEICDGLV